VAWKGGKEKQRLANDIRVSKPGESLDRRSYRASVNKLRSKLKPQGFVNDIVVEGSI